MEEENVQVVVRIRPIQTNEKKQGDISCVKAVKDGKEVQVKVGPLDAQSFRCNQCFPNDTTQATFFNESGITQLLDSAIDGYRTCAFAFGQTGAGKTFTMIGPTRGSHREKQIGLMPRSLEYIFSRLQGRVCSIKLSCLEIYHEHVFDLFAEEKGRTALSVREHANEGFYLEGAKMVNCVSHDVAITALEAALKNRQTGSHDLNSRSSRSHCVTEVYIEVPVKVNSEGHIEGGGTMPGMADANGEPLVLPEGEYLSRGKVSLIDLAGSERLKSTQSTGKVLQEAGFINRSLYVLGKVIAGLVRTNGDLNHKDVPYRDSKLTKLLITSLGGKGRTLLISCVSEAKSAQTETLRTLKFSMSCARIRNKPVKFLDPQEKLILELRQEIARLRNENKKLRSTILTAPAGTVGGSPIGNMSPPRGGHHGHHQHNDHHYRDDDDSSYHSHRSYSAQSGLPKKKIGAAGRQAIKRQTGAGAMRKTKKTKGMKGSKSDFTGAKSSHRNQSVGISPLKQRGRRKLQHDIDEEEEDVVSSLLAEDDQIRAGLEAMSSDCDDDSVSSLRSKRSLQTNASSVSSLRRQINSRDAAEDNVRRRATGPMIIKDNAARDIIPIRESKFIEIGPANNMMRSKEAERIILLEKRIERMEREERKRLKKNKDNDDENSYDVEEKKTKKKKNQKAFLTKKEAEHMQWKTKQKNGTSPYIAHLVEKPKKRKAPTDTNNHKNNAEGDKSVHDSILDELAELGLEPAPKANDDLPRGKANERHGASKPRKGLSAAAHSPTKQSQRGNKTSLPSIDQQPGGEKAAARRSVASKSRARPPLHGKSTVTKGGNSKKLPDIDNGRKGSRSSSRYGNDAQYRRNCSSASDDEANDSEPGPLPVDNLGAFLENAAANAVQPTEKFANLKEKLEELEDSLLRERMRMEDNPGEVTEKDEKRYQDMFQEARAMRQELIANGIIITFTTGDKSKSRSQSFISPSKSRDYNDNDRSIVPQSVRKMMEEMDAVNTAALLGGNSSKPGSALSSKSGSPGGSRDVGPETNSSKQAMLPSVKSDDRKEEDDEGHDYEDDYEDEFEDDADGENEEKVDAEAERLAAEKAAAEKEEAERVAAEKAAAEKEEAERVAAEKAAAEAERLAAEKAAAEKEEAERRAEAERKRKEELEAAEQQRKLEEEEKKKAAEKAEAEWLEAERIAKEKASSTEKVKEDEEDEYADDDYEDDDFEDDDGHSRGPTPRKKTKTPDVKVRKNPVTSVETVTGHANESSAADGQNKSSSCDQNDVGMEGVDGRPFKRYDYYHGDYSELKAPLETKVVGYVSNIDVSPTRVEFGSRSGSRVGHNISSSSSHGHSTTASPVIAKRKSPIAPAETKTSEPEAKSKSEDVPAETENSYVPSISKREKVNNESAKATALTKDDSDDDDYLHYALYGNKKDDKTTSPSASSVKPSRNDTNTASLEKKPSPSSITATDEEIERNRSSDAVGAKNATSVPAEDDYGADDFDDYEMSFDEND